ncbi:MAG: polysaccharide pyruvyl transferase family protein [Alphaproteobacteria bacterium]
MKILHVASFRGNIGDNANHAGFRPWFETLLGKAPEWIEFEIRDVYRKTSAFDAAFAEQANAADLVVIGGGNYFELWVKDSPTGTSISIPDEVMASIKTHIFINALGVDDAQGHTDETLGRFRTFLGKLLASDQYLVSVRNDGAMAALKAHAGTLPLEKVLHLPDGGFFAPYPRPAAKSDGPLIGINLAGDMLDQRFPGEGAHTYDTFLQEMANTLAEIWRQRPATRFILFPHIFRDLTVYADLLARLPDQLRRDRVRVAPYDSGAQAAQDAFGEYATCDAILGMRFHANVVPIGLGVPTIGLWCYDQVARLYRELETPEGALDVSRPGFGAALRTRIAAILDTGENQTGAMRALVARQRAAAAEKISAWMTRAGLRAQEQE